jgi:hypothetical protein
LERWKYAAKHNVSDVVFGGLAVVIGVGSLISAALHLIPEIIGKSSAGNPAMASPQMPTARGYDPLDWFIMACIGLTLFWTLWNASKSGSGESVKLARENMLFLLVVSWAILAGNLANACVCAIAKTCAPSA